MRRDNLSFSNVPNGTCRVYAGGVLGYVAATDTVRVSGGEVIGVVQAGRFGGAAPADRHLRVADAAASPMSNTNPWQSKSEVELDNSSGNDSSPRRSTTCRA